MDKQFKLYSVDTKAFYTEKERNLNSERFYIKQDIEVIESWAIHRYIYKKGDITLDEYREKVDTYNKLKLNKERNPEQEVALKELKNFFKKPRKKKVKSKNYKTAQEIKLENEIKEVKDKKEISKKIKDVLSEVAEYVALKKQLKLKDEQLRNEMLLSTVRQLNPKTLTPYNQITLFENALSRAMDIQENDIIMDLVIVRAYHYEVLKQLIENGFEYVNDCGEVKKYRIFTASAGQIRTKKVIFIDEEKWSKYEKTLMCGLTIEEINNSKEKGCNINKFLAYLALCNSATDKMEGFDIDKTIVIDDFETLVYGTVDHIDNKTFEVTRKDMDVLIPHSDGCGWVHPSVSKKNFMIRLPWVKGLMTPVDYTKFCDEYNNSNYKIKDMYGKMWDLKEDGIKYVFTKSQFKMYKYYDDWAEYKEKFKANKCIANMCNLEPDTKDFRRACFNYQMWQTLTDISDEEILQFTDKVDEFITNGYSNRDTMLTLLGADSKNIRKNDLQKCIEAYPEMIRDYHIKEELASQLNARKKEAKYGKFKIDATYTFLIPDVFAWMENVFLNHKIPVGLLRDNEVSCKLYKDYDELLVNRSPHLYREHAVRDNIVNSSTKKWFITDGVYTSTHDMISKILQFDNDGDKGLVVADRRLIPIAKRNMKNIVPLYYEMGKAKAEVITKESIYTSLTKAFSFNNIGKFSNKLTVMWNLDNPDENIETIAQITALNNFTIDGAKTLLVPEVPKHVEDKMRASNAKLPYFFQFAKDKDRSDVSEINNSTVNRICRNIENIKQGDYDFSSIGKFNKNYLMHNSKIHIENDIIIKYKELESKRNIYVAKVKENYDGERNILDVVQNSMKNEFLAECNRVGVNLRDAVDMIVKYIYVTNRNSKKGFLFDMFGGIIYENLLGKIDKPLGKYIMCKVCGERVLNTNRKTTYCEKCAKVIKNRNDKERIRKIREKM